MLQVNGVYSEPQHLIYTSRQSAAAVNGTHAVQKRPQRPKDGRSGSVSGIGSGQSRKVESTKPAAASSGPMLDDEFVSSHIWIFSCFSLNSMKSQSNQTGSSAVVSNELFKHGRYFRWRTYPMPMWHVTNHINYLDNQRTFQLYIMESTVMRKLWNFKLASIILMVSKGTHCKHAKIELVNTFMATNTPQNEVTTGRRDGPAWKQLCTCWIVWANA